LIPRLNPIGDHQGPAMPEWNVAKSKKTDAARAVGRVSWIDNRHRTSAGPLGRNGPDHGGVDRKRGAEHARVGDGPPLRRGEM